MMAESPAELRAKVLKLAEKTPPAPPEGVWVGTWAELEALELPEPTTLCTVGDIPLAAAETLLIYGPSNVGKSLLGMRLALSVAMTGLPVLIVQGEGSKRNFRERLRKLAKGLDPHGVERAMPHVTLTHGDFGLVEHIALWKGLIERSKPALVMLDPMVSYFRGDENAADEMATFLAHVTTARTAGASVVVVHHSTKPDSEGRSRERGSGALRAWCDEAIGLVKGKGAGEVLVSHDKSREHGMKGSQKLTWAFSDAAIGCEFEGAEPSAAEKISEHKLSVKLLGELEMAAGEMTVSQAKAVLRCSSAKMAEILIGLEKEGLLHRVDGEVRDSKGRAHYAKVIRKGRCIESENADYSRTGRWSGNSWSENERG